MKTMKSRCVKIIGIVLITFMGIGVNAATINVPADYATIQAAVNAASASDVINVAAGTYYETLNILTADITIIGASRTSVIIDPTGLASNNAGIYVAANNITLQSFTLQSTVTNSLPRYGVKFGQVDGCTLEDVTVSDAYRSGIDALGTSHLTVSNVSSLDNGGHGLSLVDCNYVSIIDITLSGNGWQNVSVATWGRYTPLGTSNVFFTGANSFGDLFQLEMGDYNNPGVPPAGAAIITYSTNPIDGADVTVQASDFSFALHGTQDDAPDQKRIWLFSTLANAALVPPLAPIGHWTGDAMYITSLADDTQYYITPGGSIQTAIDAASVGGDVNVGAGTYREQLYIDKNINLLGSGSADCIIEAPDAVDRTTYSITQWTGSVKTIDAVIGVYTASTVNIDGFKIDGRDTGPANFYGVHFFDSDGSVTNCVIDNVTYSAVPGTQSVVSLVGTHSLGASYTIDISGNTIPIFQKGGIALMGPGCSFTVNDNNVSGVSSSSIAGNCIQLSYGAHGSTSGNYVEGTAYTGDDWASTGILLFESGDVTMDGDEVYNCESGVNFSDWGWVHVNSTPVNLDFDNLNLHDNEWSLGVQMSRDNSDVNLTVTNSNLLDNGGDGFDLWGTGSSSYYTGWSNGDFTAVITGCTITNSLYDGIWTADLSGNANNTSDIDVHGCYFTGNTSSAINNTMTQAVDATGCYWDDPTGPTVGSRSRSTRSTAQSISPFGDELPKMAASFTTSFNDTRGSGETILGSVSYSPFWMANYIGDAHSSPWDWGVDITGTISDGIAAASAGDIVNVFPGTFLETLLIDKPLTLLGATAGVNKNGYTVPNGYAWDDNVETIIMHPNPSGGYTTIVDIYDTDDVIFDGFVVQELSASGNLNTSLMRVYAHSKVISNIEVVNSIIGPNTNTVSQDGTHGRMGLYIINHPYNDNGVTNSTFAGNKIFDCKGNGNNIFLWTSYYAYGAPGPASMIGTVIEDNEIYGSHRSGIETAGGFSDLVIRNNEIYDNSELPGDAASKLKYGNGILLIRGSSDKVSDPLTAFGPVDLTIEGNNIYGNSKNGIYMGPKNEGVSISNNTLYDNGWDGVMLDLHGTYWNAQFEVEPTALQYACYDCSNDVVANGNTIYGNGAVSNPEAEFGVQVNGTPTNSFVFNATQNYWGTLLCAEIDTYVSGEVDYDPWCNSDFSYCDFTCLLTEAWVDDDWIGYNEGENADGHIFGYDAFATIQEAIDAVNGSTVNVAAGTYREQLYIDKSINLLGSGSTDCIIEAPDPGSRATYSITQWTGSVKTIDAIIGVHTAGSVIIDGFKVDGRDTGPGNFYGIHFFDSDGSVTSCIIDNVTYSTVPGTSSIVSLVGTHSLGATFAIEITDVIIPIFQKGGIVLMGPGCSFTVDDNNVTGQASSSLAGNCIQLSYGAHGTTSGNYVEGTAYTGDDWASTGILLFESGDVSMDGDEVYNCESGVNYSDWGWVYLSPTPVNLNFANLDLHDNEWTLGFQLSRDNSDLNVTVTNSDLLNNGGDGLEFYGTDLDPWGGVYYTGWDNGDLTAVITGCTITNSVYDGIWAADQSGNANNADIDVHGCYFTGNTSSAINNMMTHTLDATECYWDDPTGPTVGTRTRSSRQTGSFVSPFGDDLPKTASTFTTSFNDTRGSGETVLGPISYSPFWMANYIGDAHTSPWSWGVDNTGTIGDGYATASSGDNITVYAGSYTEQLTLTPGKDITLAGEDRDLVTWIAPAGSKCLVGNMTGYTGDMNYEVSGFTFNCRALATATYGAGVYIYRATNGPLTLSIHDNKFIEDRASGDDSHWATSIFACHNRFAERDGFGDAPVMIYDNIDETWGGMTMSNTRAFDIYGNTFDGCSDAIYNGHGCPDSDPTLFFGDHHIYDNIFMNASDDLHSSTTPALDWQYYGAGAGTHMPSIIEDNTFEDNDVAMRFVFDTDMTYPAHDVTGNSFINNGMAVIVDGAFASTLDAEENYWGTLSCPVVASNVTGPVDYEPWCNSDFSFCGFACSLAEVWVDDDWVGTAEGTNVGGHIFGYDAFDVIADGVNAVSDAGTVHVFDGNYDIPINIDSRTGVSILGESEAGTIFKPATTLDWGFAPYGAGRQAAIRVFGSTGVTLSNMTMDFDLIKADNVFGLLMWNSAGEISNNTLQNMNTAGYYEFISYLRAPDYTDGARAQIDILNNTFLKTGRVAVVVHDYVNTLIEGNNFDMVVDDFGYAIELGSAATGTIRGNTFTNYDTWAATDQSTVSAIYVENSFTMGVVDPISKPVVIEGNEISNCQYGIIVGNEVPGYAGNVDIVVTIEENNIHDNSTSGSLTSGAILLTDEGKDAGSSINATVHDNIIYNNGDYGLLINTDGNGDISSTLTENIFAENYTGVSIKDYATTSTSSYSMIVHHNFFDNFLNAEDDVVGGYWDDLTTNEGNCWSDWETNIGYPLHYTISGNADARDRKPNRANCDGMGECETGEANGEAPINILDIVYLINFKYKEGPDPIPYALCSGDPNCDCEINILDIVYLINFKYKEGPAPCGGSDWMFACKLPIRGETPADAVVSINPINEEISAKTAVSKDQINEKTLEIPVVSNELINDTKKANSFSAFK